MSELSAISTLYTYISRIRRAIDKNLTVEFEFHEDAQHNGYRATAKAFGYQCVSGEYKRKKDAKEDAAALMLEILNATPKSEEFTHHINALRSTRLDTATHCPPSTLSDLLRVKQWLEQTAHECETVRKTHVMLLNELVQVLHLDAPRYVIDQVYRAIGRRTSTPYSCTLIMDAVVVRTAEPMDTIDDAKNYCALQAIVHLIQNIVPELSGYDLFQQPQHQPFPHQPFPQQQFSHQQFPQQQFQQQQFSQQFPQQQFRQQIHQQQFQQQTFQQQPSQFWPPHIEVVRGGGLGPPDHDSYPRCADNRFHQQESVSGHDVNYIPLQSQSSDDSRQKRTEGEQPKIVLVKNISAKNSMEILNEILINLHESPPTFEYKSDGAKQPTFFCYIDITSQNYKTIHVSGKTPARSKMDAKKLAAAEAIEELKQKWNIRIIS